MNAKKQEERNEIIRKRMLNVRDVQIVECPKNSPWIRPIRMDFVQDGERKDWDIVRSHDGVYIIIYNTNRKKLVFVKQFRPAAYCNYLPEKHGPVDVEKYSPSLGLSLELCAGTVDKDKPLVEIARDELREECGYEAPAEAFHKIITCRNSATSVSKHTIFYVEVTDEMHIHPGGGEESEGELIEVVDMSVAEVREYIKSEEVHSPPSFLYGVSWFFINKPEHCS